MNIFEPLLFRIRGSMFDYRRVIMIILAVVVISSFGATLLFIIRVEQRRSRDAFRLAAVKQIQIGLERFYFSRNGYPKQNQLLLGTSSAACLGAQGFQALEECSKGAIFLESVPTGSYLYDAADCSNEIDICASYVITFQLEGEIGLLTHGAHMATPSGIE